MTPQEAVMYLYSLYNVDAVEDIIDRIKVKHLNDKLKAPHKAALRILSTYIDVIT